MVFGDVPLVLTDQEESRIPAHSLVLGVLFDFRNFCIPAAGPSPEEEPELQTAAPKRGQDGTLGSNPLRNSLCRVTFEDCHVSTACNICSSHGVGTACLGVCARKSRQFTFPRRAEIGIVALAWG